MLSGAVACQPADDAKAPASSTPSAAPAAPAKTAPTTSKPAKSEKAVVPNFVGMGLQSAQDAAQEVGFYGLTSHDALGRGRMQALDRNWKVCNQSVPAGTTAATSAALDFGAVKLEEACPAKEGEAPSTAGGKMPDFTGKSMKAARAALDASTSITATDATADGRMVLMESNWQVCGQTPSPGAALNGQPVEFMVVKFGEDCP
ncbi:PASTA domain-containing protein [Streptomyces sp. TX20-6-3]|uniref:PASTA domain-containing protein n=1 Tax=Streptomyces sp. TX20-6-3 TaxID=3028705 RepID=UPI0029A1ABCF|nr:PASTA domain-containing protein [Streptomyces sp. TX20-6-3]MDX2563339.1 PASTA domain-containing protein [Streptomyces sp. TX20-6-3]